MTASMSARSAVRSSLGPRPLKCISCAFGTKGLRGAPTGQSSATGTPSLMTMYRDPVST